MAISGIARYLHKVLWQDDSLQYYAGLWSYQLEEQLLWFAAGVGHRTATYQALSWSWASYHGEVRLWDLSYRDRHPFAEVLEIYVEAIADPFGPVRSGHLNVRGPLCRAQAIRSEATWTKFMILTESGSRVEFAQLEFDEVDSVCHNGNIEFVLLNMLKDLEVLVAPMAGLLLEPTRAKPGEYRRAGYFNMYEFTERAGKIGDEGSPKH